MAAFEGFKDAKAYDAYRPTYPPEAVEALLVHLQIAGKANAKVVEIASGTGKFTELLVDRHENFDIVAVEPHDGMRSELEAKHLRGLQILDGHAARMPIESRWGDACIAAQSFHWFATEEALEEIYRVLKPTAVFGMIWNVEDYNKPRSWKSTTAWEQRLNDWIWSIPHDGHPRFRDQEWHKVFERQLKFNPLQILKDSLTDSLPKFSLPLGERSVRFTVWLSEQALWSRLNTLSQVAILDVEKKRAAQKMLHETLQMADVERNEEGDVAVHGNTYFVWTDRI